MARGGSRPGAGRRKGSKATHGRTVGATDIATAKQRKTLTELAREHTKMALAVLVEIAKNQKSSDKARVSAANALLDRGYGKPRQAPEHGLTSDDEPITFTLNIGDRGNREPAGGEHGQSP